ncbi:DUF4229 domain-containing protein [Nocardioides yefusunii]|uniref:DUF4229 domain-containing protein n=1 Tax=Nocardioides yefusunii TaxID=2500546 RepID=A0ABW1QYG1_9ACTN|nr:DUF4229 domain-containing protein [Nocardioides yefusunii]
MKEFAVYNLLRLLMLVGWVCAVLAVWFLVDDAVSDRDFLLALILAFVASGVTSWFFLRGPREALAIRLGQRADSASRKYEEMRKAPGEE